MKRLLFRITLSAFLTLTTLFVWAQKVSEIAKLEKEAGDMARRSYKLMNNDQLEEAKKLLFTGNRIYPLSGDLQNLADKYLKLGDLKNYNSVMDTAIWGLKQVPKDQYYTINKPLYLFYKYQEKALKNMELGDPVIAIRAYKDLLESYNGNRMVREQLLNNLTVVTDLAYLIGDYESVRIFNDAAIRLESDKAIFITTIYRKLSEKKFKEVIDGLNASVANGAGFLFSKEYAKHMLIFAYCEAGDFKSAETHIAASKKNILVGDKAYNYYTGLIALNKKDYQTAIAEFSNAMKPWQVMLGKQEKPAKFRFYTKRAEAYIGLKDYIKAKKDLEAALIYKADYEPALTALAQLESRMLTELKIDKTGPAITIIEPAIQRGLKVTSAGNDIMIKGAAPDPSGLKQVTINGQAVYSKEAGDFWGTVRLETGSNNFKVVATDAAGNCTDLVVEIEKPANVTDIVLPIQMEGKNYAVLIASQNYNDQSIPSLENPVADAIKLKMVLKSSYNFSEENILTLFNPERTDFKKKFLQLSELLQPEDNLIIFYAGHGIWVDKEKKGYWLLTDAERNNVNTWLPNKEVLEMIAQLPSKHTLLITDACFSGSMFKTRSIGKDAPQAIREMSEKISRVAITSGNDTEVPDESIFMKYLVKALTANKEKYLTAQKMFITQIIEAVMTESKTEPRYGTLELAGHIGGDFIFTRK